MRIEIESRSAAVILRCSYSSGEPADAAVSIYSPVENQRAFQTLRTDLRGVASFVPDTSGTWRIVADDGTGHRTVLDVPVSESGARQNAASVDYSDLFRYLGAIMLAIVMGVWLRRRYRTAE